MVAVLAATFLSCLVLSVLPAGAAPSSGSGWIRFGHFVPSAGPVDVKVDSTTIGTDLSFRDVTGYVLVSAGVHTVTVTSATGSGAVVAVGKATVPSGAAITVAAAPTTASKSSGSGTSAGGIALHVFTDDLSPPAAGDAKVRVIHTILGAPPVKTQLTTSGAGTATPTVNLSPVGYLQASPYALVAAGTYLVQVKAPNGAVVTQGQNWKVPAGTIVSIVIVEAPSGPSLEILNDAAGPATTPNGGMQTGLGGTAPRTAFAETAMVPLGIALVLLLGFAGFLRMRMRRAVLLSRV